MARKPFAVNPAFLDDDEIDFLARQRVPLEKVFDAAGLPRSFYSRKMKEGGFLIACGVDPCYNGHALKTRHGHCVQCNTARIAFVSRSRAPGYVYVATSAASGLTKVGCTSDADSRIAALSANGYGGQNDWRCEYVVYNDRMGDIETEVHRGLSAYRHSCSYLRDGHPVECKELFRSPEGLASMLLIQAHFGSFA